MATLVTRKMKTPDLYGELKLTSCTVHPQEESYTRCQIPISIGRMPTNIEANSAMTKHWRILPMSVKMNP